MKRQTILFGIFLVIISLCFGSQAAYKFINDNQILSYTIDPKKQDVRLFWKDDNGKIISSFNQLKTHLKSKNITLLFAANSGMFTPEYGPVGLLIQNGKVLKSLNKSNGKYNFTWKPNGVFYITNNNSAFVCETDAFMNDGKIKYATQSGPMLVVNSKIHVGFDKSNVKCVRNGVGLLPDGKVIFAMSKKEITFYDFAKYFLDLGCKNALYFDGAISKTYLPEQNWTSQDGRFGVMVGVIK